MGPENGLTPEGRKVLEGYLEQVRRREQRDADSAEWAVIERETRSRVSEFLRDSGRHDALAVLEALEKTEPGQTRAERPQRTLVARAGGAVLEGMYFLLHLALYGAAVSMIFGGLLRWILPNQIRLFAHEQGMLGLVLASPNASQAAELFGSWSPTVAFFGGLVLFIIANRLLHLIRSRTGVASSTKEKAARQSAPKT